MLYLLCGILFSAMIPILFRVGKDIGAAKPVVITLNYVCASIIYGVLFFLYKDTMIFNNDAILPIILGMVTGLLYYGGFYFYQKAVHVSGPSISSAFGKLGILIPMIASIILWKEIPTVIQTLGIGLALSAIVIMTFNFESLKHTKINRVLILFLLIGGIADFTNKLFEKYSQEQYMFLFLFSLFLTALIFSTFETLKEAKIKKSDVLLGLGIGFPNLLTSYFFIKALGVMKASVVFPLYSGGTIVFTVMMSAILFKERLDQKESLGIIMVIIALILINI